MLYIYYCTCVIYQGKSKRTHMVHLDTWEFIKLNEDMFVTEVSDLISKILLNIIVYPKCMRAGYFEKHYLHKISVKDRSERTSSLREGEEGEK